MGTRVRLSSRNLLVPRLRPLLPDALVARGPVKLRAEELVHEDAHPVVVVEELVVAVVLLWVRVVSRLLVAAVVRVHAGQEERGTARVPASGREHTSAPKT